MLVVGYRRIHRSLRNQLMGLFVATDFCIVSMILLLVDSLLKRNAHAEESG